MRCVAQTMNWGVEARLGCCEGGGWSGPVHNTVHMDSANTLFFNGIIPYYYGTSILYTVHPPQYTFRI